MPPRPYCMLRRTVVAQAPRLRVCEYTLEPGDLFPLHCHTTVREVFYCLEGVLAMTLRSPEEALRLLPGQSVTVEPGRVHAPSCGGDAQCRYLIIQAGEAYDFNPFEEA